MVKLSACIEMIFNNLPFCERMAAAKSAGLNAVEFWGWTGKDLPAIKETAEKNGLAIAAFCVSGAGSAHADEFNAKRLLDRTGIDAFKKVTEESIEKAKFLDCQTLIVTVGQERNDITRFEQHTNIVLALRAVAPLLRDSGVTMVVEPLNTLVNHRGYYLASGYEAFSIIEEVGCPNVKLLYDVYHQQISDGNVIDNITKHIDLIGHFHIADVPGRHEPGTGELNYRNIFKAIDAAGYKRYVGMEYHPSIDHAETVRSTLALTK